MKEIKNNIWDYHNKGNYIIIPTNGYVKKSGEVVMGRGLALQAKHKFPSFPKELGDKIKQTGNEIYVFHNYRLITFPVKRVFWERASIDLIEKHCNNLKENINYSKWYCDICDKFIDSIIHPKNHMTKASKVTLPIYLPRLGCGNGKLKWEEVKPILEKYLDDNFIVCDIK